MEHAKRNISIYKRVVSRPKLLFWYYIAINMVPSFYFLFTEPLNIPGKILSIFLPFGLFIALFSLFKNTGKAQVLFFPILFFHAFQIVLFYLFGEDVLAADMLLNVVTTNTSEVNELLGALLPSIIIVIVLYVPPTVLGIMQWRHKEKPGKHFRKNNLKVGLTFLILAFTLSFSSVDQNTKEFSFHEDIYPINLFYNIGFATQKFNKIRNYPNTSSDFLFDARRADSSDQRKIIVLVIGETSRAANWELYGYDRATNPKLKNTSNLIPYSNALTQSNVTHESVPIIMSGVGAENFKDLYHQKGIFQAFKEAGYTTISLSNQAENSSFIEYIYKQADIYKNLKRVDSRTDIIPNSQDEELTKLMAQEIADHPGDLFILLHSYGSHFNYTDRYPTDFSHFKPDKITNVSRSQKQEMTNAYNNSIRYTDHFLSETIKVLAQTDAASFLLYSADHGEDIFDDQRGKFLHSSPTPTYYQLHIAFLSWYSNQFKQAYPEKIRQAEQHQNKALSTNAIFHSLLDAGSISSPFFKRELSLLHPQFKERERVFLTDHEEAIPVKHLNLKSEDYKLFKKHHIKL